MCSIKSLTVIALVVLFTGCATLPTDVDRPKSFAISDSMDTRMGAALSNELAAHPGQSGFFLLGNGLDAFVARAVLAEAADRTIDVQYYLYHNDLTARLFTAQLLKAADRGVRVRLLVDDMDMGGRDIGAAALDTHPNIQIRFFNPFSRKTGRMSQLLTRMGVVTRRMHNKSFTVDNQIAILGGRNIGDEYFDANPDIAFSDLDVMIAGPVAADVSVAFDKYWNSELAYPVKALADEVPSPDVMAKKRAGLAAFVEEQEDSAYLTALRDSKLANLLRNKELIFSWGTGHVVYDQPEKLISPKDHVHLHLAPLMAPYRDSIKKELIIFSPYFVPGKSGVAYLTGLAKKGARVKILTNSLASNDVGLVHAGYAKYRQPLLRGGVELYELNKKMRQDDGKAKKWGLSGSSKASLHAKSFIFDRQKVFIGSLNLDPRAVVHNTEIGVIIDSPEIAEGMAQWFDQKVGKIAFKLELRPGDGGYDYIVWNGVVDEQPQTLFSEPHIGFWKRFGVGLMGLLPIESQL
jgi:putative cardiolipin synthase